MPSPESVTDAFGVHQKDPAVGIPVTVVPNMPHSQYNNIMKEKEAWC